MRSLKGRPVGDKAGKGGSGEAAFAAAVASLAAAVGEFFGNKRGGGLAPAQVRERFECPAVLFCFNQEERGSLACVSFFHRMSM